MTRLYTGTMIIDWEKMDEVIRHFLIQNRLNFRDFLVMMWENKKSPLPSATYYAWRNRGRMRATYIKRMEELGIKVDLFILNQ